MRNTFWQRLGSPVVIAEIISIVAGAAVLLWPGIEFEVKVITGAVVAIVSIFAGTNNPITPKEY